MEFQVNLQIQISKQIYRRFRIKFAFILAKVYKNNFRPNFFFYHQILNSSKTFFLLTILITIFLDFLTKILDFLTKIFVFFHQNFIFFNQNLRFVD